jgi:hypothetical protein
VTTPAAVVDVRLLEVPVPLWERAQQQGEALQREFALLAPAGDHPLPGRLLELVAALSAAYGAETSEQEELLLDAAESGLAVLPELRYRVPAAAGEHAAELGRMLDEADDHCRSGEHLLTLAADDEVVRFRHWYLGQFEAQTAGLPPVPWPSCSATA